MSNIYETGSIRLLLSCLTNDGTTFIVGDKGAEIERRKMDIEEIQDEILKKIVIECLREKSTKRPSASKLVTELRRIKNEREVQRAQNTKLVSFNRLNEKPNSYYHHFQVLLLGNSDVGKSSLFELFRDPTYDFTKIKPTLTAKPAVYYFEYDNNFVRMDIVDTAGEEQYFSLTSSYYRNVDGVFLVYNVSDKVSLQSLRFWIATLRQNNTKDNFQMLLVGNKVDLRRTADPDDLVPKEQAVEYARAIESPYVETSARDVDSVITMYNKMLNMLMSIVSPEEINVRERRQKARSTIRLSSSQNQKSLRTNNCFPAACQ